MYLHYSWRTLPLHKPDAFTERFFKLHGFIWTWCAGSFLIEACDEKYLAMKVTMIMGIMGACRANEMYNMKTEDIKDLGSAFLVNVPNTTTKVSRKLTITDNFYPICKKYMDIRPVYIYDISVRQIAEFLKLPNPKNYSGHSFRRSSATLLVDAEGDITTLKRHGGWKSTLVAEGYIDESIKNKMDTAHKLSNSIQETTIYNQTEDLNKITSINKQNIDLDINSLPSFNITHCSNTHITININK
ncbi:hypothetical protein NQ315_012490 [Exocentrus adspersus]|uniref:Tyr recombinase domain-containing protein n=1 Tax=Exocentrus adspersus TaxID=1586481 RepID=A0AAV8VBE5_9CUCU|nr:hypothetical protein NQ315_012490 [Exocentrus adspersus]